MARERDERRQGLGDFLMAQMREAVADIRSKLLDEAWFGRRGPNHMPRGDLSAQWTGRGANEDGPGFARPSFEERWAARVPSAAAPADHGKDIGIDR